MEESESCVAYDRLDLFRVVWPDNKRLLYRSELSEEENARETERCWSACLAYSMRAWSQPEAPDSAYSQLKTAVEPGLFHLCCAILSDQPAVIDELILDYGLDPHQELAAGNRADELFYDTGNYGQTDFAWARTPFDVAVKNWQYFHHDPWPSAMAMVCRLVYHCGAPKSWSAITRRQLLKMWRDYDMTGISGTTMGNGAQTTMNHSAHT
ncbi:hypothetical protein PG994_009752 [Apiospora phragmitis]|uniref:Uncharacterized protein n=1 Tax=Apiospora phragmitis TaxID=2905665 RepID=A0ABR1U739_9PEZI